MVVLGSHAHQHLERFEMRLYDGEEAAPDPFYVSTAWDSPAIIPLETPLSVPAGHGITFTCHYRNDRDQEVKRRASITDPFSWWKLWCEVRHGASARALSAGPTRES
jgi:hypothetical protein